VGNGNSTASMGCNSAPASCRLPPSSIEGIRRYLGSGMIKGIGPHFAGRLVAAFGETVFDVIERTPERLRASARVPVPLSRFLALLGSGKDYATPMVNVW
jgi:hypothetical protein